jgi:hypothetical protein
MASRSRKLHLETLEGRQLLSHIVALAAGDVSIFAKPRLKTTSVVGKIPGTWYVPDNWIGSGNLTGLGTVQMAMKIPHYGGYSTKHGTMTLSSGTGTLTFAVVEKCLSPMKLTVENGTNSYKGWSGNGTFTWIGTPPGRQLPTENTFKLKLKS